MGCVSSNLLNRDDEFTQLGSSALGQHIVSLTSTTYGLLTLDTQSQSTSIPSSTQPFITSGSTFNESKLQWSEPRPEIINSWELMSGLDADSFRFPPIRIPNIGKSGSVLKPSVSQSSLLEKFQADSFRFPIILLSEKENADPNLNKNGTVTKTSISRSSPLHNYDSGSETLLKSSPLDKFENICPPNGENRVVLYTTTLRGIRKTFEDCTAVRSAIESYGVAICERDISMDRGFKEELRELLEGRNEATPPQVFIKGRYVGGGHEVMKIVDEGWFGDLVQGLPMKIAGEFCDGCVDVKFFPCFRCNGSCKMSLMTPESRRIMVMVRCTECNENGLILCPLCS